VEYMVQRFDITDLAQTPCCFVDADQPTQNIEKFRSTHAAGIRCIIAKLMTCNQS
jgi:hypothetical protein